MGAYLSYGNVEHYVPAFPVEQVIDPTGAGDSFAGGFMGCLSRFNSQDFLKAAIFGAAMASFEDCMALVRMNAILHECLRDLGALRCCARVYEPLHLTEWEAFDAINMHSVQAAWTFLAGLPSFRATQLCDQTKPTKTD